MMADEILKIDDLEFEILISNEQLLKRIQELANEISRDYKDKTPIFVGVLNGAVFFLTDLVRRLTIDNEIDFMLAELLIRKYGLE